MIDKKTRAEIIADGIINSLNNTETFPDLVKLTRSYPYADLRNLIRTEITSILKKHIPESVDQYATQRTAEVGEGWISVEDRLPEEPGERVLLFTESGGRKIGYIHYDEFYDDNAYKIESLGHVVTHWQPLPSAP